MFTYFETLKSKSQNMLSEREKHIQKFQNKNLKFNLSLFYANLSKNI